MLPYQFYKVVHIVGIVLIMSALGGVALQGLLGGMPKGTPGRRLVSILHGIGALFVLVGGFGMLARLGFAHGSNFPAWLWVKIVVWAILAASLFVAYRHAKLGRPLLLALPVLGGLAAYMAIYKPI
jgi:uncharacterized membrane protein SirB2